MDYDHLNRSKYLLIYHIVLVTKYRKPILEQVNICEIIKEIESKSDFTILEQEYDKDHIHIMIKHSPSSLVRRIKMMSTNLVWEKQKQFLEKHYWKKKILWSNGFFICTIGNASMETIRKYIQEQ